jgi:hypothetical protein
MSSINMSALKRNSTKDLLSKLQKDIAAAKTGGSKAKDERFWNPETDAAGNGSAIVRFMPAKNEDDVPYVKTFRHSFQENGSWFIEDCPSTIGQECPCCKANGALWNSGLESDKEIARKHKRATSYTANVLVIKDPANPENEGKVKLFRFGKKIFDKIQECLDVDTDIGEEPRNPFSFFDGMNFSLKIGQVAGFRNYDKSKFIAAGDLYEGDEDKLMEVLGQLHDLKEFLDPSRFKSYADIEAKFNKVTGQVKNVSNISIDDDEEFDTKATEKFKAPPKTEAKADVATAEEDEDLSFFRSLAE